MEQSFEMRQPTLSLHRFARVLILLLLSTSLCESQLCETVVNGSWNSLVDIIEWSFGFAILCPFEISGDGCPTESHLVQNADLYMLCEPSPIAEPGVTGCIVDCPLTHFRVAAGGTMTLDGFTLKGSQSSAVEVLPFGSLSVYHTTFEK